MNQLARIDEHIGILQATIVQQQKLVDKLKWFGIDSERWKLILATMNDLMAIYQLHRQRIVAALADGSGA